MSCYVDDSFKIDQDGLSMSGTIRRMDADEYLKMILEKDYKDEIVRWFNWAHELYNKLELIQAIIDKPTQY